MRMNCKERSTEILSVRFYRIVGVQVEIDPQLPHTFTLLVGRFSDRAPENDK